MKNYPSKRFITTAMAVAITSCASLAVSAAEIPANAWYGDGFDLSATHTLGSSFSNNSTPAAPQINNTGTAVGWTGFAPQEMKYNTRVNGTWNSGATSGVVSVTRNDTNAITALLPVNPSFTAQNDTYSVGIDIIPGDSNGNNANAQQWGLVFVQAANQNYFGALGNVRIGIGREANGGNYVLRAGTHANNPTSYALPESFSASDWNSLRVDYTITSNSFAIYLNDTYVATYITSNVSAVFTHIGFEAAQFGSVATTSYFDNFYVAPAIPEPSTWAVWGSACVLALVLVIRRRKLS